ncbi:3-oxoacyl-[acyl-carrier-protein] synthase-3 [Epilithonimonas hungarica]|uniref:Beta-ketoacyl-[acyl-carrier-protein] synthase III n=2 Tax=Epilithonimonas hungarica TaxID=454006 RepID=A0A1G7S7Y3_9FLAO|nr:beta-ketoacyl-ACP synthase III [Sediminibacterium sp. C3]SDG19155.1 3-oxoacyl-[acyl-carrier-protein] synthase-3 [Epilithonimonas hungarica]
MDLKAKITATGGFVPTNRRTNNYLANITDTSNEWIIKRTGIKERRILADELATSDMIVPAIEDLMKNTDMSLQEIDCLIVATCTPDMPMPSTANIVCRKLGLKNVFGFDINSACTGFLYAISLGASLIESRKYRNVIVAGADKMSSVTDLQDRRTNILFGDGAGAVLLQLSDDETGIQDSLLCGNGDGAEMLLIEGGGSLYPASMETLGSRKHFIRQDGRAVFRNAIEKMTAVSKALLDKNALSIDNVDWLIPHQANMRIIEAVGKELGIDAGRVISNVQYYGNTTAATIPLCLWDYKDKFQKGDLLLLTAFGAGFTWGATLLKWGM